MGSLIYVAIGGMLGASGRYLVGVGVKQYTTLPPFAATFIVNLLGSFILAFLIQISGKFSPEMKLLLTTGFCGAFTTYSTFSYETFDLLQQERYLLCAGNVVATLLICFGATLLGFLAGKAVV